jgi:hypothetical protein
MNFVRFTQTPRWEACADLFKKRDNAIFPAWTHSFSTVFNGGKL